MFARQQDKESTLLPAGILGLASISVAAFVVLVVANLQ
jgi:hypothetical protein